MLCGRRRDRRRGGLWRRRRFVGRLVECHHLRGGREHRRHQQRCRICRRPAVTKEITDAYTTFFNGKTPAADRTALIENPDGFSQVLVGMASDTRAQGTGVTVKGVTLTDDTNADVSYDLLLNGTPVMPDQTGQAIKVDGKWKVASSTFCALLSIRAPAPRSPPAADLAPPETQRSSVN